MKIGAHMSVAGGVSSAIDRAERHGCETLQIFTKNASRWQGPPVSAPEAERFARRLDETGIAPVFSHASYLINLASADPGLRQQSIDAFADELDRADALNLAGVVLHPGTQTSGSLDEAFELVATGVVEAWRRQPVRRTMVVLEHTAGQGRVLGHRFEHLASMLSAIGSHAKMGVCLDTCHLCAAGYDIATPESYAQTFAEFDGTIGIDRLRLFHANDSKTPCGSRVDRHAHIGDGHVGLEPFRWLLHDSRFSGLPMVIETRKTGALQRPGVDVVDPLDAKNLETLRSLRASSIVGNTQSDEHSRHRNVVR